MFWSIFFTQHWNSFCVTLTWVLSHHQQSWFGCIRLPHLWWSRVMSIFSLFFFQKNVLIQGHKIKSHHACVHKISSSDHEECHRSIEEGTLASFFLTWGHHGGWSPPSPWVHQWLSMIIGTGVRSLVLWTSPTVEVCQIHVLWHYSVQSSSLTSRTCLVCLWSFPVDCV